MKVIFPIRLTMNRKQAIKKIFKECFLEGKRAQLVKLPI
jgi:hypothetical protein